MTTIKNLEGEVSQINPNVTAKAIVLENGALVTCKSVRIGDVRPGSTVVLMDAVVKPFCGCPCVSKKTSEGRVVTVIDQSPTAPLGSSK